MRLTRIWTPPAEVQPRILCAGHLGFGLAVALGPEYGKDLWVWGRDKQLMADMNRDRFHPKPDVLPGARLPEGVRATDDIEEVLAGANLVVFASNGFGMPEVARQAAPFLKPATVCVNGAKSASPNTGQLMHEIIQQQGGARIAKVLSGPSFAHHIADPTQKISLVLAGHRSQRRSTIWARDALRVNNLKVTESHDIWGVGFAGILKNCFAVLAGLEHARGQKESSLKGVVVYYKREAQRFILANGGFMETMAGASGGDFDMCCTPGAGSRNFDFGVDCWRYYEELGSGRAAAQAAQAASGKTIESYYGLPALLQRALETRVDTPGLRELYKFLYGDQPYTPKAMLETVRRAYYAWCDHPSWLQQAYQVARGGIYGLRHRGPWHP